jgi:agmatinase
VTEEWDGPPRSYDEAYRIYPVATQFGPDVTFLGCPRASIRDEASLLGADVVILGAPFDGGTTYRAGARFGPLAIRTTDYISPVPYRPSLALGVDPFTELSIVDAGDVMMPPGDIDKSLGALEEAVTAIAEADAFPLVLGGDHSITYPNVKGLANAMGMGKIGIIHFDAHADTGESNFGLLYGHGTPMRRLIESGAARGDRFLQIGLRGYWPEPPILDWMGEQGMRWYEMTEVVQRGLDACLTEAFERAMDGTDGVFLSVDIDVVDPGMAPGTGTPEPGGLTSRQLLDAVRRCGLELPLVGMDIVEVSPPYDGPGAVTAALANRVVLEALCGIAVQFRDEKAAAEPLTSEEVQARGSQ